MTIGEKVTKLRDANGLSQNELAKLSGIGQGRISQIESGKNPSPTTATLQKIAHALGVSMAEFDCPNINFKLSKSIKTEKSNTNSEALVSIEELKNSAIDSKREKVLDQLDHMDLNEEQQAALAYIKKMPLDKQQQSFLEIYKKYKSLSVSDQETVSKIIDSLASYQK